ncbi:hypothetical protein JCM10449v2_003334 [Rhodotorula kratochvilovae]
MPASSPLIKTVALAGAGNLGAFLVEELVAAGLQTTVLTRAGSNKSFPSGAIVKEVDYTSPASLAAALTGIDAVVATLTALDAQAALIAAAAAAGVKLFVPSEFGNPSTGLTPEDHPALYGKRQAHDLVKEKGLPAVLVWTGPFPETTFNPAFDIDFAAGKATLFGTGGTPISWTTRRDVARFTAHHLSTLTALPPASSPEILRIEGSRASFLDVVAAFEALHPTRGKVEVAHIPLEEARAIARDVEGDFVRSLLAYIRVKWEEGATVDEDGKTELSNGLWPEWSAKTVKEVLAEQTAKL